jgi:hypothetical protein
MTDLITQLKTELEINTSEELFGITPQLPDQCGNIDSIIGTLNKTYRNIQDSVRYLNRIDDVDEVSSITKDIDWESSNIIVDKELETLRSNIQLLRMWGQEWKDFAKSILSDQDSERFVLRYIGETALYKHSLKEEQLTK